MRIHEGDDEQKEIKHVEVRDERKERAHLIGWKVHWRIFRQKIFQYTQHVIAPLRLY